MALSKNFFMRKSDIKASHIQPDDLKDPKWHLRDKAYVRINSIGEDGAATGTLPVTKKELDQLYQPNDSKRPLPALGDVEITLDGVAGTLRKLKASFKCFSKTDFNTYEPRFLVPGAKVQVKYGYVDGSPRKENPGGKYAKGEAYFTVFKPTYKITKENYFDCSFEAVGQAAEYDVIDINGQRKIPQETFKTTYQGGEEESKTANLFDYLQWLVQKNVGDMEGSTGFTPKNGAAKSSVGSGKLDKDGKMAAFAGIATHVAPEDFTPLPGHGSDDEGQPRIMYVTLGLIVRCINEYILKDNKKGYQVYFENDYSAIKHTWKGKKIWSPTPFELLFPYTKNTKENSYNKDEKTGPSTEYITCDSFEDLAFAIDAGGPGGDYGTPAGILCSMNLMRSIQEAYDRAPKDEKTSTEDIGGDRDNGRIELLSFFKKLFGVIRENSGGAWDLTLERLELDEEGGAAGIVKNDKASDIYIVNKNAPMEDIPDEIILNPTTGKNGIRELAITCDIPKEMQARAMAGDTEEPAGQSAKSFVDADPPPSTQDVPEMTPAQALTDRHKKLRGRLSTDKMSGDAISAAKGLIKDVVNAESKSTRIKAGMHMDPKNVPFPLKFSATMEGIEGWRFGDIISSSYLPKRYRKSGGDRVLFTVTKYAHKFTGGDWTTTVDALMRQVTSG